MRQMMIFAKHFCQSKEAKNVKIFRSCDAFLAFCQNLHLSSKLARCRFGSTVFDGRISNCWWIPVYKSENNQNPNHFQSIDGCWWVKTISGHNGCGSGGQGAQTGQGDEDTEGLQGANIYTNWYKMVPFLVYITFTFYIIWYLRYFHFLYFWHFPFLYHSKSSFKITYNYKIYKIYRKSQAKLTACTPLQWAPVSSIYFEPGNHHHHHQVIIIIINIDWNPNMMIFQW